MTIESYLHSVNDQSTKILEETLKLQSEIGEIHNLNNMIYEFSRKITDSKIASVYETVCTQLEYGLLSLSQGYYRQSFTSIRLALELGLSGVYFSCNILELEEWLMGISDLNWSKIIDKENGILSTRFSNVFFIELKDKNEQFLKLATSTYRRLSEYVHGNPKTWAKEGIHLVYNDDLLNKCIQEYKNVGEVILYVLVLRYLKSFDAKTIETMEQINDYFKHIDEIRAYFGGPKD